MKRAIAVALLLALSASRAQGDEIAPTFVEVKPGRDDGDTYERNAMGVIHYRMVSVSPFTFLFGGEWWRPYRGRYRLSLSYREFFESLGRPDLADEHDRRRLVGGILIWGGLAAEIAGAYLFLTGLGESATKTTVGLGLFGAGLVASAVGAVVEKPVLDEKGAAALAGRYNELLRARLELGAQPGAAGAATELRFAPAVMPGGIAVVARASW